MVDNNSIYDGTMKTLLLLIRLFFTTDLNNVCTHEFNLQCKSKGEANRMYQHGLQKKKLKMKIKLSNSCTGMCKIAKNSLQRLCFS